MFSDLLLILRWWLMIFFLGLLALPLNLKLFSSFRDRGWAFSKIIGIIVFSYLLFFLARFHLVPFSLPAVLSVLSVLLAANIWYWWENRWILENNLTVARKEFVFEELLFFIALTFWSFIRGFAPRIEGLEKFMDFGFVNSILRSSWFPPRDMWFAGSSINYYYFGHFQAAVLTRLSNLDPAIAYNLLIATIFALVFTASFSLVFNMILLLPTRSKNRLKNGLFGAALGGGLISAFLLSMGGNLHSAIYTFKDGPAKYWYPDATRFIGYNPDNPNDKTIHEFPSYSFVVADLHGHLNDLPAVLLFFASLFALGGGLIAKKRNRKNVGGRLLFLAFLLAIMYMTNSWDFFIYGALFAIYISLLLFFLRRPVSFSQWLVLFKKIFTYGILVLLAAVVFSLPFSVSFKPMAQGIAFVNAHTLWWQFFVLWGFFWFLAASFYVFIWFSSRRLRKKLFFGDLFIVALVFWATALIAIPEVVYVKDIYVAAYHRANTMFKLVYQSFVIYALVSGYIFFRISKALVSKSRLVVVAFSFLFLLGFSAQLIYPYFAIKGYYGRIVPRRYQGLYGMGFLKSRYPDDYRGILWLNKNVGGQPVVLEAAGDSYTFYNRVSAMTGLPTVEGWIVHEWLWRGGYETPSQRQKETRLIFEGEDDGVARYLLKKYRVRYVFVGSLEREKYSGLKEARFARWGQEVFSSGSTRIYRLD